MLKSMTGFGRAEQLIEGYLIKVQIKSVNHRYSDFAIKVPRYYAFLEDKIRNAAMTAISRGKVEIFVTVEQKEDDDREITLNRPVAEQYIKVLKSLSEYGVTDDLSVSSMIRLNDIFDVEYKEIDEEKIAELVLSVFSDALDEFIKMREEEGKRLAENLNSHINDLLSEVSYIEKASPECVEKYRERLRAKLNEILGDREIDETRLITEAAIFADKVSVDEETVRLRSHVCAFTDALKATEPIGKKLDFIVQSRIVAMSFCEPRSWHNNLSS